MHNLVLIIKILLEIKMCGVMESAVLKMANFKRQGRQMVMGNH